MGSHHVDQAGLELLTSSDPPTSTSQSAGITCVSHRIYLRLNFVMLESDKKVSKTAQDVTKDSGGGWGWLKTTVGEKEALSCPSLCMVTLDLQAWGGSWREPDCSARKREVNHTGPSGRGAEHRDKKRKGEEREGRRG